MSKIDVEVLFTGAEETVQFEDVTQLTFINSESHGQGPAGSVNINANTKRLILHSNRVDSVFMEGKA